MLGVQVRRLKQRALQLQGLGPPPDPLTMEELAVRPPKKSRNPNEICEGRASPVAADACAGGDTATGSTAAPPPPQQHQHPAVQVGAAGWPLQCCLCCAAQGILLAVTDKYSPNTPECWHAAGPADRGNTCWNSARARERATTKRARCSCSRPPTGTAPQVPALTPPLQQLRNVTRRCWL